MCCSQTAQIAGVPNIIPWNFCDRLLAYSNSSHSFTFMASLFVSLVSPVFFFCYDVSIYSTSRANTNYLMSFFFLWPNSMTNFSLYYYRPDDI